MRGGGGKSSALFPALRFLIHVDSTDKPTKIKSVITVSMLAAKNQGFMVRRRERVYPTGGLLCTDWLVPAILSRMEVSDWMLRIL